MPCDCCTGGTGNPGLLCGPCRITGGTATISDLGPFLSCTGGGVFAQLNFWLDYSNLNGAYGWVPGQRTRLAPASGPGSAGVLIAQLNDTLTSAFRTWHVSALGLGVSCQSPCVPVETGYQICASAAVAVWIRERTQESPIASDERGPCFLCSGPAVCTACFPLDSSAGCSGSLNTDADAGADTNCIIAGPYSLFCPVAPGTPWPARNQNADVDYTWF